MTIARGSSQKPRRKRAEAAKLPGVKEGVDQVSENRSNGWRDCRSEDRRSACRSLRHADRRSSLWCVRLVSPLWPLLWGELSRVWVDASRNGCYHRRNVRAGGGVKRELTSG